MDKIEMRDSSICFNLESPINNKSGSNKIFNNFDTRRNFLKKLGLGLAATTLAICPSEIAFSSKRNKRQPNIIFIFIDDMGYGDLSCYGNKYVQTINIDRLAEEGVRLTQFYVNSPICSPSRVAVTTGMYPARWRINSYLSSRKQNRKRDMADYLNPKAPTLARTLKQAGYATAHFGKWHMGGGRDVDDAPLPQEYGFDESLVSFEGLGDRILIKNDGLSKASEKLGQGKIRWVEKHEMTDIYVNRAIDFIHRNKDKPFYINLWPNDVHDAHVPKPQLWDKYKDVTQNEYEQKFFAVLDELDRQIGRLMNEISRLGLDEDTIIIFTSDNGPTDWPRYYKEGVKPPGSAGPFRGRKWSLYEGGIRTPFIIRWKGKIPAGQVNEKSVVCGIDLFPSLCSLAGIEIPQDVDFDGQDMSGAFLGKNVKRKSEIFWEYRRKPFYLKPGNPEFVSPNLAIRQGRWKLLINDDGSGPELYNLTEDTGEKLNCARVKPEIVERLSKKLLEWRKSLP